MWLVIEFEETDWGAVGREAARRPTESEAFALCEKMKRDFDESVEILRDIDPTEHIAMCEYEVVPLEKWNALPDD